MRDDGEAARRRIERPSSPSGANVIVEEEGPDTVVSRRSWASRSVKAPAEVFWIMAARLASWTIQQS